MLWRALGDTWGIGHQLVTTGSLAWYDGDYATASTHGQEAVDLLRQHSDKWSLARGLGRLGYAVLYLGDVHQARANFSESLALWQEIGNMRGILYTLIGLGGILAQVGQLDRLDEDARRLLQIAAVIGRTFAKRVLQAVSDPAIDLDRQLNVLQRGDVIRESARTPEQEYIFHYGLMREVTYQSILIRQRRVLHRQIGETLEALYADRLEEHAALLAQHFDAGGDPRAAHYSKSRAMWPCGCMPTQKH